MRSAKFFVLLLSSACFLFGCCSSAPTKTAAAAKPNAISADAETIFQQTEQAVRGDKSIPVAKRKTIALNSLYAYHTIIAAYQGLKIPASSVKTGCRAVDVALLQITSTKIPVTAGDAAAAKSAVILAGGTP